MGTTLLILKLILMMAVGYLARRLKVIDAQFGRQLSSFIMGVPLPCLIIKSMSIDFNIDDLLTGGISIFVCIAVLAVSFVLGHLYFVASRKTSFGRLGRYCSVFTNYSFLGVAMIEAVCGAQGLFFYMMFLIPVRVFYFGFSKPLLAPPGEKGEKASLKSKLLGIFSPATVSVIIGLICYVTGFKFPGILGSTINDVGSLCSPLGLILCGIALAEYDPRKIIRAKYFIFAAVRNVLIPLVIFAIASILPINRTLVQIAVIYAALPIATLLPTFVAKYDPSPEMRMDAAGVLLISTVCACVTLPLWTYVLLA